MSDRCQQPRIAGEPVTGHRRTSLLVPLPRSLGPALAVVFDVAGANRAAAAVLRLPAHFKDSAEKVKWLIQPECSLGITVLGPGFPGRDRGLSEAEGAGREL